MPVNKESAPEEERLHSVHSIFQDAVMKVDNQDGYRHVILSGAKNLPRRAEILRRAQNDMAQPFFHGVLKMGQLFRGGQSLSMRIVGNDTLIQVLNS